MDCGKAFVSSRACIFNFILCFDLVKTSLSLSYRNTHTPYIYLYLSLEYLFLFAQIA